MPIVGVKPNSARVWSARNLPVGRQKHDAPIVTRDFGNWYDRGDVGGNALPLVHQAMWVAPQKGLPLDFDIQRHNLVKSRVQFCNIGGDRIIRVLADGLGGLFRGY